MLNLFGPPIWFIIPTPAYVLPKPSTPSSTFLPFLYEYKKVARRSKRDEDLRMNLRSTISIVLPRGEDIFRGINPSPMARTARAGVRVSCKKKNPGMKEGTYS